MVEQILAHALAMRRNNAVEKTFTLGDERSWELHARSHDAHQTIGRPDNCKLFVEVDAALHVEPAKSCNRASLKLH